MAARKTLLELVQDILSSMDSDNVNSISDTVESQQVVDILEETYYEFISRTEIDYYQRLEQLESVSDTAQPNKIKIPDNFSEILCLKYRVTESGDTQEKWKELKYLQPCDFLDKVHRRDSSATEILTVTSDNNVPLYIYNERPPSYWTSFDNQHIYFDSYDSDVDTTLQASKSSVLAKIQPAFTRADTAVPDIPTQAFPYLLNEAKSKAFLHLKQSPNAKAEGIARRQYVTLREKADRVDRRRSFVNYGR